MTRVAELHRYPVKSMLGEALDHAQLTEQGILGDRAWALRDETRRALTGAKRFPELMSMRARFLEEPTARERSPAVALTDRAGAASTSNAADINDWLSQRLAHPVTLWPLLPPEAEAHYRREAAATDADMEGELREVFARTADEPLPDLSRFPPILFSHSSPPGTYFDAFPLLLLTRSAVAELTRRARAGGSASVFDERRFRPNLLLETPDDGFVEDAWCGRRLCIGTAVIQVEMTCPRCIMTTHGFLDLPRDPRIMRSLVEHHGGDLGVYASVVTPGAIRVGDEVQLL